MHVWEEQWHRLVILMTMKLNIKAHATLLSTTTLHLQLHSQLNQCVKCIMNLINI